MGRSALGGLGPRRERVGRPPLPLLKGPPALPQQLGPLPYLDNSGAGGRLPAPARDWQHPVGRCLPGSTRQEQTHACRRVRQGTLSDATGATHSRCLPRRGEQRPAPVAYAEKEGAGGGEKRGLVRGERCASRLRGLPRQALRQRPSQPARQTLGTSIAGGQPRPWPEKSLSQVGWPCPPPRVGYGARTRRCSRRCR
jgi:hypothetical protein